MRPEAMAGAGILKGYISAYLTNYPGRPKNRLLLVKKVNVIRKVQGASSKAMHPGPFGFISPVFSSLAPLSLRMVSFVPRYGSRCFLKSLKKIIRTHSRSEKDSDYIGLVPPTGLEPVRDCSRQILSLLRVPISSRRQISKVGPQNN